MATLQHILTGCAGTPRGGTTRDVLVRALRDMEAAVPLTTPVHITHNRAFRKAIHEARLRLEAGDEAALPEERWRHLERVLAGCACPSSAGTRRQRHGSGWCGR